MMRFWCLLGNVAVAKYVPAAYFNPSKHGFELLKAAPRSFPAGGEDLGFNPGIASLSSSFARRLQSAFLQRNISGVPKYIVAFRQAGGICSQLWSGDGQPKDGRGSTFGLLDADYRLIDGAWGNGDRLLAVKGLDIRLMSYPHRGDRVLMTAMQYLPTEWRVSWLKWSITEDFRLIAKSIDIAHEDVKDSSCVHGGTHGCVHDGRNFGILWDGNPATPFQLLRWIANPMDVHRGMSAAAHGPSHSVQIKDDDGKKIAHNNVIPIHLGHHCPNALLAFGHEHRNDALPAYTAEQNATLFGNTYGHVFILFQKEPPFAVYAKSPVFCLPSLDDPAQCDAIQYISGAIFNEASGRLLLTYGINDCTSASTELRISDVLLSIIGTNTTVCPPLPADAIPLL